MALQRTRRPSLRSGRSLRSLGSPLNAYPFGGVRLNALVSCLAALVVVTACRSVPVDRHGLSVRIRGDQTTFCEGEPVPFEVLLGDGQTCRDLGMGHRVQVVQHRIQVVQDGNVVRDFDLVSVAAPAHLKINGRHYLKIGSWVMSKSGSGNGLSPGRYTLRVACGDGQVSRPSKPFVIPSKCV